MAGLFGPTRAAFTLSAQGESLDSFSDLGTVAALPEKKQWIERMILEHAVDSKISLTYLSSPDFHMSPCISQSNDFPLCVGTETPPWLVRTSKWVYKCS